MEECFVVCLLLGVLRFGGFREVVDVGIKMLISKVSICELSLFMGFVVKICFGMGIVGKLIDVKSYY